MDYDFITNEEFDTILEGIVDGMNAAQIIAIPGVYEELKEALNNDVLSTWERNFLEDLVLIPDPRMILPEHHDALMVKVDWFEQDGILLVRASEMRAAGYEDDLDTPDEAGLELDFEEILRVGHVLKRYNDEDGYYHA